MVLLKKEINGKTFKTKFEFDDEHIKLVKIVLECLEGKMIDVLKGDEENTLTSISILDWFPIVCSGIQFNNSGGSYITFYNPTIMALTLRMALHAKEGPPVDVFTGKIQLSRDLRNFNDAFCFTLIHKMQHAINALKYAYPAITNWVGFLFNIININEKFINVGELSKSENFNPLIDRFTGLDRIQDEAPIEEELKILEETFGPPVNYWFREYSEFINDAIMK